MVPPMTDFPWKPSNRRRPQPNWFESSARGAAVLGLFFICFNALSFLAQVAPQDGLMRCALIAMAILSGVAVVWFCITTKDGYVSYHRDIATIAKAIPGAVVVATVILTGHSLFDVVRQTSSRTLIFFPLLGGAMIGICARLAPTKLGHRFAWWR
jgi:hypothetical protein